MKNNSFEKNGPNPMRFSAMHFSPIFDVLFVLQKLELFWRCGLTGDQFWGQKGSLRAFTAFRPGFFPFALSRPIHIPFHSRISKAFDAKISNFDEDCLASGAGKKFYADFSIP